MHPVRAGIRVPVILSQGQREIGIDRDEFLVPFLFRQQLDHLRRPGMHASHRLMRHAAGGRPLGGPGICKPLYRKSRAAEFRGHDCVCYVQFNHLYGIMVYGINNEFTFPWGIRRTLV